LVTHISRKELALGALIFLAYAVFIYRLVSQLAPLGWDEAVYAVKGRAIRFGTEAVTWEAYRAPGLPIVLSPIITSGDSALRLIPAVFGAIGIANTWWLAKRFFGALAGGIAAAGLALTPTWLRASTQIWPDIPGAVLGLAAITAVILATEREGLSWWALLAAPLTFLATLIRFGAPIPIAIGLIIVSVIRVRVFMKRPVRAIVLVVSVSAAVAAVVLTPLTTGIGVSPMTAMGSLLASNDFPISRGFSDYTAQYRGLFGGWGFVIVSLGIGLGLSQATRLRNHLAISATTGIATVLVLAAIIHGELRYLSPSLPFLWIAAAGGLATASTHLPAPSNVFLAGFMVLTMIFGAAVYANDTNDWLARWRGLRSASQEVGAASGFENCGVLSSRLPVAAWYSGCKTFHYAEKDLAELMDDDIEAVYLIVVDDGTAPVLEDIEIFDIEPDNPMITYEPVRGDYFYPTTVFEVAP